MAEGALSKQEMAKAMGPKEAPQKERFIVNEKNERESLIRYPLEIRSALEKEIGEVKTAAFYETRGFILPSKTLSLDNTLRDSEQLKPKYQKAFKEAEGLLTERYLPKDLISHVKNNPPFISIVDDDYFKMIFSTGNSGVFTGGTNHIMLAYSTSETKENLLHACLHEELHYVSDTSSEGRTAKLKWLNEALVEWHTLGILADYKPNSDWQQTKSTDAFGQTRNEFTYQEGLAVVKLMEDLVGYDTIHRVFLTGDTTELEAKFDRAVGKKMFKELLDCESESDAYNLLMGEQKFNYDYGEGPARLKRLPGRGYIFNVLNIDDMRRSDAT